MRTEAAAGTVSERTASQGPSLSLSAVLMRISDTVLRMEEEKHPPSQKNKGWLIKRRLLATCCDAGRMNLTTGTNPERDLECPR